MNSAGHIGDGSGRQRSGRTGASSQPKKYTPHLGGALDFCMCRCWCVANGIWRASHLQVRNTIFAIGLMNLKLMITFSPELILK